MNLNEWASLSDSQHKELIVQWYHGQSSKHLELAEMAAAALKCEFNFIPDIKHVHVGGGADIHIEKSSVTLRELVLQVCTLLPEHQKIEKLPSVYFGFPVKLLNLKAKRDRFVKTLTFLAQELMGWSEVDILKWANERTVETLEDSLSGGYLFVVMYDKGPVKLACDAVLDNFFRVSQKALNNDRIDMRNSMLSIIWGAVKQTGSSELDHPDVAANLDWNVVKGEIGKLFDRE